MLTARANAVAMRGSGDAVTVRVVANVAQPMQADGQMYTGRPKEGHGAGPGLDGEGQLRTKAILAFQHVDGADVVFLAVYAHEYGPHCSPVYVGRVFVECVDSPPACGRPLPDQQVLPRCGGQCSFSMRGARSDATRLLHAPPPIAKRLQMSAASAVRLAGQALYRMRERE
jgi:hypothetical protein